jgi:15-cis-phytoene synthase
MNTIALYDQACQDASEQVVRAYSTSFGWAIRSLQPRFRGPIKSIYGFVRFADEIVDTFHVHDQRTLLDRFVHDTGLAIAEGISLNPILHGFQQVVHQYRIDPSLIDAFFRSMRMDLDRRTHDTQSFTDYVFGSAEAVGLMCLGVFCEGDDRLYERLAPAARRLGAAFQKVNFLRDLQDDRDALGRTYFPQLEAGPLGPQEKRRMEADIAADLDAAMAGIRDLPDGARFGVYMAYLYYRALFRKIQLASVEHLVGRRIRVRNRRKLALLTSGYLRHSFGLL